MSASHNDARAVRSADANHLDFTSIPLVGLIGVARAAAEGGAKYGRYNYMLGFPVHDLLNHAIRHVVMFLLGDRSEPHLEHAAWGLLAAVQSYALDPDLSAPFLLGPGARLSDVLRARLDAEASDLVARRAAGEFDGAGEWRRWAANFPRWPASLTSGGESLAQGGVAEGVRQAHARSDPARRVDRPRSVLRGLVETLESYAGRLLQCGPKEVTLLPNTVR